ncbi:MAG: permease prefix domain 1-containing protein [Synergistaceae bacterium]|jgi:hypothetical protein|nr:permease prefix domain 1-containing protein [Synergistaceae bacterium]
MNIEEHIDAMFAGYADNASMKDFREELCANLTEKIESLKNRGLDEDAAMKKALGELGDISVIADELSQKKRREVFEIMYMNTRNYMSSRRVLLFVLCGAVLGFAVIASVLGWMYSKEAGAAAGSLMVFGIPPACGLIFLSLTQETAGKEAMSWKRALMYSADAAVFLFGTAVFWMTYLNGPNGLADAVAVLIPFVLPSAAFGAFLVLTETDRSKPWVTALRKEALERENELFESLSQERRFELLSGALWIAAAAGFVLLTMTLGIKFSWLSAVAAVVCQMLLVSAFIKK